MFFTSKTDFEQMYWQILLARFIIGWYTHIFIFCGRTHQCLVILMLFICVLHIIFLFIEGITTGLSSSPAAVYAAEIATPKLRGRLTLLTSMAIAIGILMIYVLGYIFPVSSN